MTTIKFRQNLWSGIVSILIGVVVYLIIPSQIKIRDVKLSNAMPSNYVPLLVVYLMIIFGALLVIQSLVLKKDKQVTLELSAELHAFLYFLIIVAYVILMPIIGFLISSMLFCSGALLYMRIRNWKYYLAINLIAAFLWFSFEYLFNVPLP